jgi:hypothetical protein
MMRMMIEKLREIENSMQDYPFLTNRESAVILYITTLGTDCDHLGNP